MLLRPRLGRVSLACLITGITLWAQNPLVPAIAVHQDCRSCHQQHDPVDGKGRRGRVGDDAVCISCHLPKASNPGGKPQSLSAARLPGANPVPAKVPQEARYAVPPGGSSHGVRGGGAQTTSYQRVVKEGAHPLTLKNGCSGCHDPHGKRAGKLKGAAFDERGQLLKGMVPVAASQVCFSCHAGPEAAPLTHGEADVGALFSKGAGSRHGMGRLASEHIDLPSLRMSPFKDRLDCTSCHANPDTNGLRGPHFSKFPSLLRAAYGHERDSAFLGGSANDLCYLCHDKRSIESNGSFPLHREHILGFTAGKFPAGRSLRMPRATPQAKPGQSQSPSAGLGFATPCATCHDPHGSRKYPSLIAFDSNVVTRSSLGAVDFSRSGLGHGTCTLSCHGYDHLQTRY